MGLIRCENNLLGIRFAAIQKQTQDPDLRAHFALNSEQIPPWYQNMCSLENNEIPLKRMQSRTLH